jgi:2-polyprenyl-3-methyl-5-hydroxy-6-metoxy-1,4-benzoquinol methylase
VAALRLPGDERTELVRSFYFTAPFPGYPPWATPEWLRARAARSPFSRLLDNVIAPDARVVEVGCGTGQMSLFLASKERIVIGADLARDSLLLGAAAGRRFGIENAFFVETDLARPGLRQGAFDVVYCSGVLHHTPNPRLAFRRVTALARPGGLVIIGLYNSLARVHLRVRRAIAKATRMRWIPFDPVLNDRNAEPERREAWLRDQYLHPEEHSHSIGEVRRWFSENGIDFIRTYPSAMLGGNDDEDDLLAVQSDYWPQEAWLVQLSWIWSLGPEGGLFVTVGRRQGENVSSVISDDCASPERELACEGIRQPHSDSPQHQGAIDP